MNPPRPTRPQALLVLPHLRVQNANAISSPQRSNRSGHSCATCSPCVIELVATKPMRVAPCT